MATYADRVEKSVVRYEPGPLPEEVESLGGYVISELKRLGDVRYADGTDWNPVSGGEGIYFYNGTLWVKL